MNKFIKRYLDTGHRIRVFGILCFVIIYASAANIVGTPAGNQKPSSPPPPQGKKKIELRKAKTLDKREGFIPQILRDSVVLFHDGALMYCDSAYLNMEANSFEAFDNIEINQGDTLFLYGDYLNYDGNTKLLKIREDVRLENRDVTLFTDSLNYDRAINLAYYFDGGMLVDSTNQLSSYWGQYEPHLKLATFSDSVTLVNTKFTLHSDTLLYNTMSKVATILGPSTIVSDSAIIHTQKGWYNTTTEESMLLGRSLIVNKEGDRTLTGDSISYHKKDGYAEVFGNMFLQDTTKKAILRGHYGFYNEFDDSAFATDSAFCIEYSQGDSLYLHGDTLRIETDSIYRNIFAYKNVRFYRSDIQGVSDSIHFSSKDTMLYLLGAPIIWNETHQITGDTIDVYLNDSTVDLIHVKRHAFAIQDIDSIHFNQLKGRSLKAYLENGDVHYILVEGNAESIFYPEEKDKSMLGMNQTESSFLSMVLKEKKLEKLKLWPQVKGTMTPLEDLDLSKSQLPDFKWYESLRPKDKDDIFRKEEIRNEIQGQKKTNRFKQE